MKFRVDKKNNSNRVLIHYRNGLTYGDLDDINGKVTFWFNGKLHIKNVIAVNEKTYSTGLRVTEFEELKK